MAAVQYVNRVVLESNNNVSLQSRLVPQLYLSVQVQLLENVKSSPSLCFNFILFTLKSWDRFNFLL